MTRLTDAEYNAIQHDSRDQNYGPGFFKFVDVDHGYSNHLFGYVLYHVFRPESVIEFGCGTGGTLLSLKQLGAKVAGVDGSSHCLPFIERIDPELVKCIRIQRLEQPFPLQETYSLAVSIETLEHVTPEGADNAVDTICKAAPIAVVTACPPVGRNPLHLNEQLFEYWIDKFEARGRALNSVLTVAVRSIMRQFSSLHRAGMYPVIPAWYISDYFGVFTEDRLLQRAK
jgi:SAM-dependent methyltransferase